MNFLEFEFETESRSQLEQLVALLHVQDFEGFEEEENTLKAFIAETRFDEADFTEVLDRFASINYTRTVIEQVNWNQQWEEGFRPVIIDEFAAIRADFHEAISGVEHEVIITPKMSFGTGHHATTFLMIRQMKDVDFTGKSVLDFGTGTGVLAILAEKCGATEILAIDYDEWSIINTRENLERNNSEAVEVAMMDTIPAAKAFDIILANINLNILTAHMKAIAAATKPGGTILFSGFLYHDEEQMKDSIQQAGLQFLSTSQRGDWISIVAKDTGFMK
ncbi:MAG: 50S ribosomal protein L11 methyltransferase [Ferruginibacter sp.]|nr:50S ribosomal protein L11 methyltransferase [Ferruginibacter sp.]